MNISFYQLYHFSTTVYQHIVTFGQNAWEFFNREIDLSAINLGTISALDLLVTGFFTLLITRIILAINT